MSNYRDDVSLLKQARHDAAQLTIFHNWIQEHPEWDYQAAREMIQNYYDGEDWTAENLTESAERLAAKGAIKPLRPKTAEDIAEEEMEERKELTDFIISNRAMTPDSKRGERIRFMNPRLTSIETLRQIKINIENRRRLDGLSKDELKVVARGPEKHGFMEVPVMYRSKIMLLDLANTDLPAFKRLVQRCGKAAIDAILQSSEEE